MNENTLTSAFNMFVALLDPIVIGLVLISGYFSGKYLNWSWLNKHVSTAWKTLIFSAILVAIYIVAVRRDGGSFTYTKVLISYFVATSFYELIIKALGDKFPFLKTTQNTQMDHWRFEPGFSSPNDLVLQIGSQQFSNVTVAQIQNATQGAFYIQNGYICNDNLNVNPGQMTLQPPGGTTYFAVPVKRPK